MSKSKTTSNSPEPSSLLLLPNEKDGKSAGIHDQLFEIIFLSIPADFPCFSLDRGSKEEGFGELDVVLLLLMDYPCKICLINMHSYHYFGHEMTSDISLLMFDDQNWV